MIEWTLPLEIQSPNIKEHWSITHERNKRNLRPIQQAFALESDKPSTPCEITIQRLYNTSIHQKRWDDDNLITAMKGIRDTIADLIIPGKAAGQADNAKLGLSFHYDQITCSLKQTISYVKKGKKILKVKLTHVRILIMEKWEIENACQQYPTRAKH